MSKNYLVALLLALTLLPFAGRTAAQSDSAGCCNHPAASASKTPAEKKRPASKRRARAASQTPSKTAAKTSARSPLKPKPRLTPASASGLRDAKPGTLKAMAIAVLEKNSVSDQQALDAFATRHRSDTSGALARLVLGYHAYQQKRYTEARTQFDVARKISSPLEDYGDYYMAMSVLAEGDRAGAAELLRGFASRYPLSALAGQALLREVEILIALDRSADAIPAMTSPSLTLPQPSADLLLGEAYNKSGEPEKAVRLLQKVYYVSPTSFWASSAEKQLRDLRIQMGASYPAPTSAMRLDRADRLFAAGRWKEAETEYREVAAAGPADASRDRARVRVGVCLYHANENQRALAMLKGFELSDAEADAERIYTIAAIHRRLDQTDAMEEQLQLLAKGHPDSPWYEKALFLVGNYYLVSPEPAQAVPYYTALYQQFPHGEVAPESHWRVAWRRYRERNLSEARRLFEEHIRNYPSSAQVSASIYWAGRALEEENPSEAAVYFRKLASVFPNYYYGQVARARLEALPKLANLPTPAGSPAAKLLEPIQRSVPDSALDEASLTEIAQSHRSKSKLLESAWLIDLAIDELKAGTGSDITSNFFMGRELAHLEEARGRYNVALSYAKRLLTGYFALDLSALPREDWQLLFPLPWWDEINRKAQAAELDPYVVAGLIRQESEFNPEARSHSNARGLMQLLPTTAKLMAKRMTPRRTFRLATLTTPEYNVAYGTFYLRQVLNQFNGSLEQALAAYNAGENRVVTWLGDGKFDEPAEFVESIPFTETREYVQAVLRNAALYRKLYLDALEPVQASNPARETMSISPETKCSACAISR